LLLGFVVSLVSGAIIILAAIPPLLRRRKRPKLVVDVEASKQTDQLKEGVKTMSRTAQFVLTNIAKGDARDCSIDVDSWDYPFQGSYHLKLKDHEGNEAAKATIGYLEQRRADLFTITAKYSGDTMSSASLSYKGHSLPLAILPSPSKGKKRKVEFDPELPFGNGPSADLPDGHPIVCRVRVLGSEGDIHVEEDWALMVSVFAGGIIITGNKTPSFLRGISHLSSSSPFQVWNQ
jgi:hypothetical protein